MSGVKRTVLSVAIACISLGNGTCALAQIIPDSSLPNNSNVIQSGNNFNITGGTQAGGNLFHSFQEFSVPTGSTAFFNNTVDVQNIISRVTGSSVSNIEGWIKALGSANLFLLNPNGIIFGPNARLDIGGSFLASTASSIKFADSTQFSAKDFQSVPLLTVSIPLGLQYGENPGSILVQGDGQGIRTTTDLIDTTIGLRVQPNQTLALVGGNISLEGATLKTAGGRIELGSVAGVSLVNLNLIEKGFSLSYDMVQNFGNIQLSQQTAVDASGEGGGDVQVTGRRVTLSNGSGIEASTLGTKPGGSLVVNALESIEIRGTAFNGQFPNGLLAIVYEEATGSGSDLRINTGSLLVKDGARVSTTTFGEGKGGNLTINASGKVQILGRSANNWFGSGLFAQADYIEGYDTNPTGSAGDLTINATSVLVQDGAAVSSSTFTQGKGGNLTVNASDVQIIGRSANGRFPSSLSAQAAPGVTGVALGTAADLTINTNTLLVKDGAQVSTGTFGRGKGGNLIVNAKDSVQIIGTSTNGRIPSGLFSQADRNSIGAAGDLTINTSRLLIRDGARVSAATLGAGKGGSLTVNASHSVQLIGTSSADRQFTSGLFTQSSQGVTGDAGDLTINTDNLLVRDGAEVAVRSLGLGNAGNLNINARSIHLNNKGSLSADTRTISTNINKEQATIIINSRNLLLRRNSNITTNATGSNVIGGNININTGVLAAFEDSDISANSLDFRGGQVKIKTEGIFGIQFRRANTPLSDITASGASSEYSGTVTINAPDVDPSSGLVELPVNLVDTSQQIATGCNPGGRQRKGSFTATGRSGLPASPTEPLTGDAVLATWVILPDEVGRTGGGDKVSLGKNNAIAPNSPTQIVEAQSWQMDDNGDIVLVARAPAATPMSPTSPNASCSAM